MKAYHSSAISITMNDYIFNNDNMFNENDSGNIHSDIDYNSMFNYFFQQINQIFIKIPQHPYSLESTETMIYTSWTLVYKLSTINFDSTNSIHLKILNELYKIVNNNKTPPSSLNDNLWKNEMGFQTSIPINDFRMGGILNILLPLYFYQKFPSFSRKFTLRLKNRENAPLMLIMILIISTTIECAQKTAIFNNCEDINEAWNMFLFFFLGLCKKIYSLFKNKEFNLLNGYKKFQYNLRQSIKRYKSICKKGFQVYQLKS
ncbi:hypothetical protein TRFO_03681 [Tritrichomonas foetus]|uniref:ELMO domain-containing protein n=1 Tax=Tritrichomonas foetus TaxID=1144522 RepID=A0A1J4KLQ9_9EUKA|nr:hypothetical protein TRFO_03681 [Tritrichomonas foetus]|eukprot:OHT12074.1 hypothetical protein TRFO_03681 [Tritrichomonas foetus]